MPIKSLANMKLLSSSAVLILLIALFNDVNAQTAAPTQSNQKSDSPTEAAQETDIDARTATWVNVAPEKSGASVSMPAHPRKVTNRFNVVEGQPDVVLHQHITSSNNGQKVFVFNYNDLHADMSNPDTKKKALEGAVRGSVARVSGSLISQNQKRLSQKWVKPENGVEFVYVFSQRIGREANGIKRVLKSHSVVYIFGQRMYELTIIQTLKDYDEALARKFIDSFRKNTSRDKNPESGAAETADEKPGSSEKEGAESDGKP